jgi:hypothetical protein
MKQHQSIFALVAFALCTLAFSQSTFPATQSSSYQLAPVNSSGMAGTVYIADYGAENTFIVVNVVNADASLSYPAHIHEGSCGSNGEVAVPLEDVKGSRGLSVTMTDAPYTDLVLGNFYVNVHHPEDINFILACGELSAGAQAAIDAMNTTTTATPETTDQTGLTQGSQLPTGVKPEEFATQMRTEGYGIYPVNNKGISGQIQIAEEVEGGSRVIVTLSNIQSGQRFNLEIFQGDCGPDRPSLVKLLPVPSVPSDPNASETHTNLSYAELAEGNNFVYVYAVDGTVLACGEVGAGALSQ